MPYLTWKIGVYFYYWEDKILFWIAWHLPKKVVYRCAIRLNAYATVGKYGNELVPELRAMDALERWRVDWNC